MTGFRLIAISPRGEEAIRKFQAKDRKCSINIITEDPLTISFVFKGRFAKIPEGSIRWFVPMTLKGFGCKEGVDYELEVIL